MEEIWREVPGYEGLYEVSNRGVVRSLNYLHTGRKRVLRLMKDNYGYLVVHLCKDGQTKTLKVHRIVAQAFIANPLNLPDVNHINEDKTDNRANNLEFCTAQYNNNFGTHNARIAKTLSKTVLQYDKSGNFVQEWPSVIEVQRRIGWLPSCISQCCHGKRKSAYGFVWSYSESVPSRTVQDVLF